MSRRRSSSFRGRGGKGGGRRSVPYEHSQPSLSRSVPPSIPVSQSKEEKSNWLIEKWVLNQTTAVGPSIEIPSIESLNSYLALNEVDQNEGLGTWMGFRFFQDMEKKFSGAYLNLTLNPSTTPVKMRMVFYLMLKKVLEPDDDMACWIECIKELGVWKQTKTGGFAIHIKTDLSETKYGDIAEKVSDFFRLLFEEHGVTFPRNGFDVVFIKHMSTLSN